MNETLCKKLLKNSIEKLKILMLKLHTNVAILSYDEYPKFTPIKTELNTLINNIETYNEETSIDERIILLDVTKEHLGEIADLIDNTDRTLTAREIRIAHSYCCYLWTEVAERQKI